ncbi:MAG: VanZ family protein [Lachnospiraceae bacterium]|nr:VanZ family protein [Lachnospiraceae bacterium]
MDVTNNDRHRKVAVGIFVLYIILLLYFLFFSENLGRTGRIEYRYNFVPFKEIKRFLFNVKILGLKNVIINLGGNIVMFMPLGYFLPRIAKYKKGIVYTTFECFEFSFLVEIFQLYTKKGCCDVDDIILNTLGGFLGYIVYYICLREKIKKCQGREDVIDLNLQKKNNQKKG